MVNRLLKHFRSHGSGHQMVATDGLRAAIAAAAIVMAVAPVFGQSGAADEDGAILKSIRRETFPEGVRVTLELEGEASFRDERFQSPPRVFIDLKNTRALSELSGATLDFPDGPVRQIRVGRPQRRTMRVVLDFRGAARYGVYDLFNPYRIVVDIQRPVTAHPPAVGSSTTTAMGEAGPAQTTSATPTVEPVTRSSAALGAAVLASPSPDRDGNYPLSRQLGLGISRVVIDAGHGGHDPGARARDLTEADLTLDIALRLEKLLLRLPRVEVVMTRRTDIFVSLEERTAIANGTAADLLVSVHVNASSNPRASGIETYVLSFAPNSEAELIAARENAGASRTMRDLSAIANAIALNSRTDESRDLATLVQNALVERLRKSHRDVRSLGVKQAPFMVLVGATMPSVLAEVSFLTNRQEAALLKTQGYRQAISEALFNGIARYQRSLGSAQFVAAQ